MSDSCISDNTGSIGSSNPIQSKIVINDHATGTGSSGNNIIEGLTCDSSVSIGNVVRINGSTVVNAQADSVTNSLVIGICTAKDSSTVCTVQVTGFTNNIFVGLSVGNIYFLSDSTPGAISTIEPISPGSIVLQIGRPRSSTSLILNIPNGIILT
jgi:hypothetical protein